MKKEFEGKTVFERVTDPMLEQWVRMTTDHPERPVPKEVFVAHWLNEQSRKDFLLLISDAVEERFADFVETLADKIEKATKALGKEDPNA